jgi:hypothetical protein
MRSFSASLLGCGTAAALALTAASAFAHIDLLSPPPRYTVARPGGVGSKQCPCGGTAADGDRVCDVPAAMSHDTNRSTNVTTYEAGQTIMIRMEEYINHSGRFRVAFDADGADMVDFNNQVLMDVADDQGVQIYNFSVTLPNMTCENCTLQVIQDMNGNTTTRVADPSPDSTYYSCADIRLVAPGSMGGDDGMDDGDDGMDDTTPEMPMGMPAGNPMGGMSNNGMNAGTGMMGGLGTVPPMGDSSSTGNGTPMAPSGSNMGTTSTGVGSLMPSSGSGSAPMGSPTLMSSDGDASSSGGCSLSSRAPASSLAALSLAGAFMLLAGRRRARVRA